MKFHDLREFQPEFVRKMVDFCKNYDKRVHSLELIRRLTCLTLFQLFNLPVRFWNLLKNHSQDLTNFSSLQSALSKLFGEVKEGERVRECVQYSERQKRKADSHQEYSTSITLRINDGNKRFYAEIALSYSLSQNNYRNGFLGNLLILATFQVLTILPATSTRERTRLVGVRCTLYIQV